MARAAFSSYTYKLLASAHREVEATSRESVVTMRHLCEFEAACFPEDYWRLFDLADMQLFSGEDSRGAETYARAIELVPLPHRVNVLRSPATALEGLLDAAVFESATRDSMDGVVHVLNESIQEAADAGAAEAT